MKKDEIIAQLKSEYKTLNYGINNQVFQMTNEDYEKTIESWADAQILKQEIQQKNEEERQIKISAYKKLGLTDIEIEAILPSIQKTSLTNADG